jgi:hypothetical protein
MKWSDGHDPQDFIRGVTWLECYDENNVRYWMRFKSFPCRRLGLHSHFYGERRYTDPLLKSEKPDEQDHN